MIDYALVPRNCAVAHGDVGIAAEGDIGHLVATPSLCNALKLDLDSSDGTSGVVGWGERTNDQSGDGVHWSEEAQHRIGFALARACQFGVAGRPNHGG